MKATYIEHLGVDYQSASLHSQDLHSRLRFVDEDKDIAREWVTPHLIGDEPRERVEAFAHIAGLTVEPIAH